MYRSPEVLFGVPYDYSIDTKRFIIFVNNRAVKDQPTCCEGTFIYLLTQTSRMVLSVKEDDIVLFRFCSFIFEDVLWIEDSFLPDLMNRGLIYLPVYPRRQMCLVKLSADVDEVFF